MPNEVLSAIIAVVGGFIGGIIGAGVSVLTERAKSKRERVQLLANLSSLPEVEKVRIQSYMDLWSRLEGISTWRPEHMVDNLPKVQGNLQEWYYNRGGGLIISGSANNQGSTKATFFAARDLVSSDPTEIWQAFHRLRRSLRSDLRIFQDEKDEAKLLMQMKEKLKKWEV